MLKIMLGCLIGLFGGYILLMDDFRSKGKQSGYNCSKCKAVCPIKHCFPKFEELRGVKK